jgi:hypothetical protein
MDGVRGQGDAGAGQDAEAGVAAAFGPFVVLFGQDGADEADQGIAAGEDPDDIGAAADLAVQPLLRVVGPDLPPEFLGEAGERQHVRAGCLQVLSHLGQLVLHGVDEAVVLGRAPKQRRAGHRPSAAAS